jgi:hypothetical protein
MFCDGCSCDKCQNTEKDQSIVMQQRGRVLARNPQSFLPKVGPARRAARAHQRLCARRLAGVPLTAPQERRPE